MSGQIHVILAQRPTGMARPAAFRSEKAPEPVHGTDRALLAVEWLSMDPYLRSVIADRNLGDSVKPGQLIPGVGLAQVLEAPARGPVMSGDYVVANCGWCRRTCITEPS